VGDEQVSEYTTEQLTDLYNQWTTLERNRIVKRIENQICFNALADADGRCSNHSGKCYELRQLINSLQATDSTGSALPNAQVKVAE
jgi:hypothetical protein